jgi:hypothetical protein
MTPDPTHLKKITPDYDYPENIVSVALRFFRWLCERENDRLALRRFDDKELKEEIDRHAEGTKILVHHLELSHEFKTQLHVGYGWPQFSNFCEEKNIDKEEFKESRPALDDLRLKAILQFHLAYHDLLSGNSNPKIQFPMFKDVWTETRPVDTPSNEYVSSDERRPPGRPGLDKKWLTKRLHELEAADELPPLEGPWSVRHQMIWHN